MHFDAITLACLASELQQTIETGRIQQVLLPDDLSLGLEVYGNQQRSYLLISADPSAGRLYFSGQKLRRGTDAQPPLLLRLRKLARGAFISAISQPDPAERILQMTLDHPKHGVSTLVVELIGRQSNLILLGPNGRILECMRRFRPPKERASSQRTILPGRVYEAPSPMERLHPLAENLATQLELLVHEAEASEKARSFLVEKLCGISPTLAREIVWRVAGDAEASIGEIDGAIMASVLMDLWSAIGHDKWQPGIVVEDEKVVGFAGYELHFRGSFVPTASLSIALEQFYGAKHTAGSAESSAHSPGTTSRNKPGHSTNDAPDPYAALRRTVSDQIRSAHQRVARQLRALAGDEPEPGEPEDLRVKAEWLLALHQQIDDEQTELTVNLGDRDLIINLNPNQTAVEQAEQMFDRAAKLERAAEFIPKRRRKLEADQSFITQLQSDLLLAENQPELIAIQEEVRNAGYLTKPQKKAQKAAPSASKPRRYISPDGLAILVGRNARQNDLVTFSVAGAADTWLHVRDAPGSHVVVRNGGQPVSEETLVMAAQLAAFYSSQKGERAVQVAYTEKRFVTRVPGGRPGQVYMRNADTVTVAGELPKDAMESP